MEENIKLEEGFSQVCVWPGTKVGQDKIVEFKNFMLKTFDSRIQYLEEIKTLPDQEGNNRVEGTGGRNDVFFAIHNDDVGKFSIPRLRFGIRWLDDVLAPANYRSPIYPRRVFKYKCW